MATRYAAVTRCAAAATTRTRAFPTLSMPKLTMHGAQIALAGIYTLAPAAGESRSACGSMHSVRTACAAPSAAAGAAGRSARVRRLLMRVCAVSRARDGRRGTPPTAPMRLWVGQSWPSSDPRSHLGQLEWWGRVCGGVSVGGALAWTTSGLVVSNGREIVYMSVT